MGAGDVLDGQIAKRCEDIPFHAMANAQGRGGRPVPLLIGKPLPGKLSEGGAGGERIGPLLLQNLDGGILPLFQRKTRRIALLPGLGDRHFGEQAESEELFQTAIAIFQPPGFSAGRRDVEVEASAIPQFITLAARLRLQHRLDGQHGRTSPGRMKAAIGQRVVRRYEKI